MSCVPTVFYVQIKLLLELTTRHKTFLFGFSVFAIGVYGNRGGGFDDAGNGIGSFCTNTETENKAMKIKDILMHKKAKQVQKSAYSFLIFFIKKPPKFVSSIRNSAIFWPLSFRFLFVVLHSFKISALVKLQFH